MKKIIAILLSLTMLLTFTACGGDTTSDNSPTASLDGDTTEGTKPYNNDSLESILSAITVEAETAARMLEEDSALVLEKLGESYTTYDSNKTSVTDFYNLSLSNAKTLYANFETISMDYFRCVAANGLDDYDTWDDSMGDFYDAWDDSMEDYYDTWDDVYENIYDKCDNLIEDASDDLEYSEYFDAWSEMYKNYSNAWAAMYEAYFDAWSNTYSNYSHVWSGFFSGKTDVDAILKEAAEQDAQPENTTDDPAATDAPPSSETEDIPSTSEQKPAPSETTELIDGMRPEFKEAMDSYEAFYDEYCDFMKKYADNPGDIGLLAEYAQILERLEEMNEKFEAWEDADLNEEELKYYLEVYTRISQKLIDLM